MGKILAEQFEYKGWTCTVRREGRGYNAYAYRYSRQLRSDRQIGPGAKARAKAKIMAQIDDKENKRQS